MSREIKRTLFVSVLYGLINLAGSTAHSESITYHLRTQDGAPMPGETVTFYLASNNTVIDTQVTDAAGDCTLTDNVFVGQPRCVAVNEKPGWTFPGCNSDTPNAPCMSNPVCGANTNVYFFWGVRDVQRHRVRVFGGPKGYVNLNLNEQATIAITAAITATRDDIEVKIYTLRGKLVVTKEVVARPGPGIYQTTVMWDGRDLNNNLVASGIYVVYVRGGGVNESRKIAIVRK